MDENFPGRGTWMGGSWEVLVGATGMRDGRGRWEIGEGDCATGIRKGRNFRWEEEDFVTEGNRGNGEGKRKLREMGEGRELGEGRGSRVWPGNRKPGGREGNESPEKETVEKVEGERGGSWRRGRGHFPERKIVEKRWICSWGFVEGNRRCARGGR